MDRSNNNNNKKKHNSKYQCHMAACCTDHRSTYFSQLLNRSHTKILKIFWKEFRRMDQQAEKKEDKTERVIGLGRRTKEEIVKWNQMTALRFQTGGGGTSDVPGFPSGKVTRTFKPVSQSTWSYVKETEQKAEPFSQRQFFCLFVFVFFCLFGGAQF